MSGRLATYAHGVWVANASHGRCDIMMQNIQRERQLERVAGLRGMEECTERVRTAPTLTAMAMQAKQSRRHAVIAARRAAAPVRLLVPRHAGLGSWVVQSQTQ